MKSYIFPCFFILLSITSFSQQINGLDLLNKTIQYHDPFNNWETFNNTFNVSMKIPNKPNRDSKIIINLPKEYFYLKTKRDTLVIEYSLNKDQCMITLNGKTSLSKEKLKANNLSCDRANLFKNYYTYLYGLPMKLKDSGTIIDNKVEQKTFKGKDYLVLKATYKANIGNDVWFFYFDPKTYAMEVYQFYKTDAQGVIKKDSGEYILLTKEETINGIKMPKNRAWYYNKGDKYLGTDILKI